MSSVPYLFSTLPQPATSHSLRLLPFIDLAATCSFRQNPNDAFPVCVEIPATTHVFSAMVWSLPYPFVKLSVIQKAYNNLISLLKCGAHVLNLLASSLSLHPYFIRTSRESATGGRSGRRRCRFLHTSFVYIYIFPLGLISHR